MVASARLTNEELYLARHLAKALNITLHDVIPRKGQPDGILIPEDRNPNTAGAKLLGLTGETPGTALPELLDAVRKGAIQGVISLGEDLTECGFSLEDLAKLKALVTTSTHVNATTKAAHVVLPGAAWAEKRGSMINIHGRLQRLNKAVKAPGNAHDTWEILRDLIVACGGSNGIHTIEDVLKRLSTEVPALNGLTFSKIGYQGLQVLETTEKIPLLEREKERKAKGIIVG
jgi:NADH-quinone oxidoreductase subunit G